MNVRETFKPWCFWLSYAVRQGGEYRASSRFLKDAEGWPRERIERWLMDRLRAVVRHAVQHTEGHREPYRGAGVCAEAVRSPADLRRLPVVTKQMLQENLAAFTATTPGATCATTRGSTGIPFGFYSTRADDRRESAFMHAGWRRAGWDRRMRTSVLRGAFVGSRDQTWTYDRFWSTLLLSSYSLTRQTHPTCVEMLARHRIEVLHAYPS